MIHKRIRILLVFFIFFLGTYLLNLNESYADTPPKYGILLTVNGAIGPATDDYIHRGIKEAFKKQAKVIIIEMDTPGGLDKSMRAIVQHILRSPIPIVTYVYPPGARAASAGTYILYASHVAAMAPGTNLGAATPIQLGGQTPAPKSSNNKDSETTALSQKMTNDAVAYIRALAELRGHNSQWAELAVTKGASITANNALKIGVIDLIANDLPDLLQKLNGRKLTIQGSTIILDTHHLTLLSMQPDWRARVLAMITDPSIAYILLLIGIYGLIFEFANPGFVLPGAAGAIALLLALYAFQLLPINYVGLALIILGLAFLIAELFLSSFGVLGVGGIISFIVGSILLLDTHAQGYSIHWYLILLMAIISSIFFFLIIGMAIRSKRRRVVTGMEELPGMIGIALMDFKEEGLIKVHGETWQAQSKTLLKKNQKVRVLKVEGLILTVVPMDEVKD